MGVKLVVVAAILTLGSIILLTFSVIAGCSVRSDASRSDGAKRSDQGKPSIPSEDETILNNVESFAGSDARKSEESWAKLQLYPQRELITRLLSLAKGLSPTDHRRVLIAFTLCNINYDYSDNKQLVLSALTPKPTYEHFYSDWAVSLVDRLMQRGDRELLSDLFRAAAWSDGMTSEELSSIYVRELENGSDNFIFNLKSQPAQVRDSVYRLAFYNEGVTQKSRAKIRGYLLQSSGNTDAEQIKKEILQHLSDAKQSADSENRSDAHKQ